MVSYDTITESMFPKLEISDYDEEFALGIDPKSLHAMVLMQMVYNAVVCHSGGFLKHVEISVTWKGKNKGGVDWGYHKCCDNDIKLGYKFSILDLDLKLDLT